MATHEKVYAPTGEMFEVPSSKVSDLVLNRGWTRSKPETVKVSDQSQDEEAPVVKPYVRKPKSRKLPRTDNKTVTDSE
jgi:cytochrome oxidase assembly protein ShyY1